MMHKLYEIGYKLLWGEVGWEKKYGKKEEAPKTKVDKFYDKLDGIIEEKGEVNDLEFVDAMNEFDVSGDDLEKDLEAYEKEFIKAMQKHLGK